MWSKLNPDKQIVSGMGYDCGGTNTRVVSSGMYGTCAMHIIYMPMFLLASLTPAHNLLKNLGGNVIHHWVVFRFL